MVPPNGLLDRSKLSNAVRELMFVNSTSWLLNRYNSIKAVSKLIDEGTVPFRELVDNTILCNRVRLLSVGMVPLSLLLDKLISSNAVRALIVAGMLPLISLTPTFKYVNLVK
jgi:hypothetical protein